MKLSDVGGDEIVVVLFVVVGTMEEHDEVGILLDGAGFTKVGENGARVVATSDATRELGEGDDGDFELAGKEFLDRERFR